MHVTIGSFGKATLAVIVLTAAGFLTAFSVGVLASSDLMAPWSAAAFLIAGVALWIGSSSRIESSAPHQIGALLVFALGAVVSGEHLAHVGSTAFDRLLFPNLLPTGDVLPGRPAELAGFRYCLLGIMLFFLRSRRRQLVLVREWSAVAILVLCSFGFVAVLSSWGTRAPQSISPYAALLGMLAAVNVLATGPNGLLLPLLRDRGPAGLIARSLMPLCLIVPAVTLILRQLFTHVPVDDSRRPDGILFTSINILAALAIVWICALRVLGIDLLRRKAEDDVRASRDDLDRRIQIRTQELLDVNKRLTIEAANRQHAQNELQQTNAMLASLIEACPLAIIAFNLDRSVRKSNAAADAMRLPENSECRALAERASRGESIDAAAVICHLGGKPVHLSVWASPVLRENARPDGVVVMAADVTERKALETRIRQSQRIESLGVLAGGLAHDFNNLLTGVMGNASMLQSRFNAGTREARAASDLIAAAQAMAKLTSQMLAYSGRGRVHIELLDLSSVVRQITGLLRAAIPKNVRLNLLLEDELPPFEGDSSQIQQVVMNLAMNGAEAIGSGPAEVDVSTSLRHVEPGEFDAAVMSPAMPAEQYLVLEMRDSGTGMDETTIARIFDPFFTTKFAGRGLGLSAVLGIVRSHHGAMTVQSALGAGSTFRAYFPRASVRKSSPQPATPVKRSTSGAVLVVDDEEFVLALAQAVLGEAGYEVLTASDGQQALEIYAANAGRIDAVVLDMMMPVMGGEEALERLIARWPEALVIATSGYGAGEGHSRLSAHPAAFLQKPYTATQLISKVAEAIQTRA